jgi:hypothetical protein
LHALHTALQKHAPRNRPRRPRRLASRSRPPGSGRLRRAPVEITVPLQLMISCSSGNAEFYPQTELSSRPERSVVERSAVFLSVTHTLKPRRFSSPANRI